MNRMQEDNMGKEALSQEGSLHSADKEVFDTEMVENFRRREHQVKKYDERKAGQAKNNLGICGKCGEIGHKIEDCFKLHSR